MSKLWLQVAVVYIVVFVPSQPPMTGLLSPSQANCSREGSSIVRHFIQTVWRPIFKKFEVKMPDQCPLHFSHDVFKVRLDYWFIFLRVNHPVWSCPWFATFQIIISVYMFSKFIFTNTILVIGNGCFPTKRNVRNHAFLYHYYIWFHPWILGAGTGQASLSGQPLDLWPLWQVVLPRALPGHARS